MFGCSLRSIALGLLSAAVLGSFAPAASAQLTDITQAPNTLNAGIKKSLTQQIGLGRGDVSTPNSSAFLIERDPFRAVARGRQLFQRKFTEGQGLGPRRNDGVGDIEHDAAIGAGL
ncbi:MAG: thiol oxidoreductase-like protein, partial [Planctomycetes bacterium]|nr:thiol oxidoreductase-like protein [Planctomycetota bacterium]